MIYVPPKPKSRNEIPGNFGGENLREYCGMTPYRRRYYKNMVEDHGPITTQRLYASIEAHAVAKRVVAKMKGARA